MIKVPRSNGSLIVTLFLVIHVHATSSVVHIIRYQGPFFCSKLSKELRTSPSLAIFRTRIKKRLTFQTSLTTIAVAANYVNCEQNHFISFHSIYILILVH